MHIDCGNAFMSFWKRSQSIHFSQLLFASFLFLSSKLFIYVTACIKPVVFKSSQIKSNRFTYSTFKNNSLSTKCTEQWDIQLRAEAQINNHQYNANKQPPSKRKVIYWTWIRSNTGWPWYFSLSSALAYFNEPLSLKLYKSIGYV